jgi:nucleoside-diphosphate-sugar epimerase
MQVWLVLLASRLSNQPTITKNDKGPSRGLYHVLTPMSKIYVFGSSGFIGRNLCKALEQQRLHIIGIDRRVPTSPSDIDPNSLVIFLASVSQHTKDTDTAIEDLKALDKVFQLAKRSKSTVFVASTSSVSGGNTAHACYAKWAEILSAHYKGQVRTSFLRLYSVYGPGQHDNLIHRAITAGEKGTTLTVNSGHFIRDWIHVDDVVDYIITMISLWMARRNVPPVVHIGTGRGLPVETAIDMIETITDKRIQRVVGPQLVNEPVVSVAQKILQGWIPKIKFEQGVLNTYHSYLDHDKQGRDTEAGSEIHGQGTDEEAEATNGCGSC